VIRTERNIEYTKEESRDLCSLFVVRLCSSFILSDRRVHRMFCLIVIFLFENKLKTDKEKNGTEIKSEKIN